MTRNGVIIDQATPDHMFLLSENHMTIGVTISNVTMEDRGVVYTCDDPNSPPNFGSSLTLNVTGMYVHTYVHIVHIRICMYTYMHAYICMYVRM